MDKNKNSDIFSVIFIDGNEPKAINVGNTPLVGVYLGEIPIWTDSGTSYKIEYKSISNGWFIDPPSTIKLNGIATIQLKPNETYKYPTEIVAATSIINATKDSYDSSNGILKIKNPTGNVTIQNISFPHTTYYNFSAPKPDHGSWSWVTPSSNPGKIYIDQEFVLKLVPDTGYNLPTEITCTGATAEYDFSSKDTVVIKNPTADVQISAKCAAKSWNIYNCIENCTVEITN